MTNKAEDCEITSVELSANPLLDFVRALAVRQARIDCGLNKDMGV